MKSLMEHPKGSAVIMLSYHQKIKLCQMVNMSTSVTSAGELAAIMKRNPRARFHAGSSVEEAMKRATEKIRFSQDTDSCPSPKMEPKRRTRNSMSAIDASLGAPAMESPKAHDLLMMGREILTKQNDKVRDRIEKNPRILCTDTEVPTTLHEGCKYNALHLAAKCNNTEILQHILNLISSLEFMKRIYPTVNQEQRRHVPFYYRYSTKQLVNCYLNTPDKMTQETPLHYACKFSNVECVEVLLAHPWCDLTLKNYDKLTAYEIIGSRVDTKVAKVEAIKIFFEERYIVPIWRDEDVIGDPPAIGEVSYINDLGQSIPPPLLAKFPDFSISLLDPCNPQLLPMRGRNSTMKVFMSQPPAWKIKAFAGPVSEKRAQELRQLFVRSRTVYISPNSPDCSVAAPGTPGRAAPGTPGTPKTAPWTPTKGKVTPNSSPFKSNQVTPPTTSLFSSPVCSPFGLRGGCDSPTSFRGRCDSPGLNTSRTDMSIRVRDVEKGLERIAFEYCNEMNIPWCEYWPFLGAYCDLTSDAGMALLEEHISTLEAKRLNNVPEEELNMDVSEMSESSKAYNSWDDLIDKLGQMNLDGSGLSSPGSGGYCRNPKCRLEARFCNCENVIPELPCVEDDLLKDVLFTFGDEAEPHGVDYRGAQSYPFMGIRKLDASCNTDSFGSTRTESEKSDFQWPGPDLTSLEELFATAPSSPVENDVFEECCNKPLFLTGERPGKLDLQVFQVLQDFEQNIDRTKHLATFQWFNSMRAYGEPFLPSRRCPLGTSGYSPKRLWEPPYISTPRRGTNLDLSF
ncbi:Ankyrin repeat and LEM domain-containing protein 2 [Orchesella cincta]|uniref:Ankyrin repeat and LEM domain-containing protein 2 n=1 Tax=Orchesella cincta TaxID=48709 RepID=A0A1D2N7M6_ORCCI|nr:Ankyrin repeat and LEM domain-containing protein 2 [Orchesella cincta]